jgi:TolB protein
VAVASFSCDLLFGGGGGGGGGGVNFAAGFTYSRKDDRNVYVADERDYLVTAALTQSANIRTPSFSRDGRRIVFVRGSGSEAEIAIVPAAGGDVSTVLASSAQARNFKTPVFSPDGTRIAFSYDEGGPATSVGLINADGTGFQRLVGGSSLAYASPSFAPDGQSLVVIAGNPGIAYTQVERVSLATGMPVSITNTLGNEVQSIVNRLVVSPDGTRAVFDGRLSSGVTRLFLLDLGTRQVTQLYAAEANTNDTFPCWMSATEVAFSSDAGGNDNVYRVTLPTSSPELLVPKAIEPWYGAVAP